MRKGRPICYACYERPARKGSRFCTQRCAAEWADALAAGNSDAWCPACQKWVEHFYNEGCCENCGTEVLIEETAV